MFSLKKSKEFTRIIIIIIIIIIINEKAKINMCEYWATGSIPEQFLFPSNFRQVVVGVDVYKIT